MEQADEIYATQLVIMGSTGIVVLWINKNDSKIDAENPTAFQTLVCPTVMRRLKVGIRPNLSILFTVKWNENCMLPRIAMSIKYVRCINC